MPGKIEALYSKMTEVLKNAEIKNWNDISDFLDQITENAPNKTEYSKEEFHQLLNHGAAFITYDFGIDGVSIEIFKYAQCLEKIFKNGNNSLPLHFIAGDFNDKADVVLKPHWNRFRIEGFDGWSKWYGGKWFSQLYHKEMPEGSIRDHEVAQEIWREAVDFAGKLGKYLSNDNIHLIIPVNIPTNPGNMAAELAIVITSELMGSYVISSNHDYYWEGGKPASKKDPWDPIGPRDHFFKNIDNKPFFSLFKRLYPWNGKRWLQVNINSPQSEALVNKFGFDKNKVFELGTSISDEFFEEFSFEETRLIRRKMAYILSDGKSIIPTKQVHAHLNNLRNWMQDQYPLACGYVDGLKLDTTTDKTIYCLQPTRVIERKRIEKDLQLLKALMQYPTFRDEFELNQQYQLVLHITGPVPIEHQHDLETVLKAYIDLCESIPENIAKRIFIAFSVGTEDHPSLKANGFTPLCIEQIYRLATVILFPSETEGRGLPIIESSAGGIPIICSRYYPEEVFAEVVGEGRAEEEQIKYLQFPEEDFSEEFLSSASELLLHPERFASLKEHNKNAVKLRYSTEMIRKKFEKFIEVLRTS
jgi:hypothetical protein